MSTCSEYLRTEELQARAQLYSDALRGWQTHLRECATCAAQQDAAQELRYLLGGEAAPRVSRGFTAGVLQHTRASQLPASAPLRLSYRTRVWLAVHWVAVVLVCGALASLMEPTQTWYSVALALPALFTGAAAVLAILLRRPVAQSMRT